MCANIMSDICLFVIQEVFSAVRDRYMRDGEGFLLVYSLTQRSTFVPLEKVFEQIKRVKDTSRVPVVLVGNKVNNIIKYRKYYCIVKFVCKHCFLGYFKKQPTA